MPIYEYDCQHCGYDFEEVQRFSDPPVELCPECGNLSAKRKVSISAFHLKGGGWYKDGYGGKPSDKPETSDSSKDKKEEKKADVKDDSGKKSDSEDKNVVKKNTDKESAAAW